MYFIFTIPLYGTIRQKIKVSSVVHNNSQRLLDFVWFIGSLVHQIGFVPVSEETRVKHIFYVIKVFHGHSFERVHEEHAIFGPVRPRHQTVDFVIPVNLCQKHSVG